MDHTKSPYIFEGTAENFSALVLENSLKGPVLVNYWASYAGPCMKLYPVLEKLVEEFSGKFLLVNVGEQANKALDPRHRVNSVPTVKIFRNKAVLEEIRGAFSEQAFRQSIRQCLPKPANPRMLEGVKMYREGDREQGLALLAQAALDDPDDEHLASVLGRLLFAEHRYEQAQTVLSNLSDPVKQQPQIANLLTHLRLIQLAAQVEDIEQQQVLVEKNPRDCALRLALAARYLVQDEYAAALQQLLELMRVDKHFEQEIGRKALLAIFGLLGSEHPLVEQYRVKMAQVMH